MRESHVQARRAAGPSSACKEAARWTPCDRQGPAEARSPRARRSGPGAPNRPGRCRGSASRAVSGWAQCVTRQKAHLAAVARSKVCLACMRRFASGLLLAPAARLRILSLSPAQSPAIPGRPPPRLRLAARRRTRRLAPAARSRPGPGCCTNLYARATPLSAQTAEWPAHKDLCIYATLKQHQPLVRCRAQPGPGPGPRLGFAAADPLFSI